VQTRKEETIRGWLKNLLGGWGARGIEYPPIHGAAGEGEPIRSEAPAAPPAEYLAEEVGSRVSIADSSSPSLSPDLNRFTFSEEHIDSAVVFAARAQVNQVSVCLNRSHPAFSFLSDLASGPDSEKLDRQELWVRYRQLHAGARLMIAAWIEHEHQLSGPRRRRAEEAREDWGRTMRRLADGED
jgi:hypothetical protein